MKASIFDLDGTLLDSLHVWSRVDEIFFSRRDMPVPENYGCAIAGMSYPESADYTKTHFHLPESREDIIREWMALSIDEYSLHVRLKPGAKEYLQMLKDRDIKLAVATALPEYLYKPCLTNLGIFEMFDALCSTEDTGGRGKACGEVFLLAAKRLGVQPKDCTVFEDVYEGICGAKTAGMRAVCVLDRTSLHTLGEIEKIADRIIHDFTELL